MFLCNIHLSYNLVYTATIAMPSLFDDLPPEMEANVPGVLGKRKSFDDVNETVCKQPKTGKYCFG